MYISLQAYRPDRDSPAHQDLSLTFWYIIIIRSRINYYLKCLASWTKKGQNAFLPNPYGRELFGMGNYE